MLCTEASCCTRILFAARLAAFHSIRKIWNPCAAIIDACWNWNFCCLVIQFDMKYVFLLMLSMDSMRHRHCISNESMHKGHWCTQNLCSSSIDPQGISAQQVLMRKESLRSKYWCTINLCAESIDVPGISVQQALMHKESLRSKHWCARNLCTASIDVQGISVQQALMRKESLRSRHWCPRNLWAASIDSQGISA